MPQLTVAWQAVPSGAPDAAVIAESHMVMPGAAAFFAAPGVEITNLGRREALIALRRDGTVVSAAPIAPALMPAEQGDWVAHNVLTARYVDSCGGIDLVRICCCQYGPCGHCGMGKHASCTTRAAWKGNPPHAAATHVVGRRGGAYTEVWTSGTACRWFCPCEECARCEKCERCETRGEELQHGLCLPCRQAAAEKKEPAAPAASTKEEKAAKRRPSGDLRVTDTVWLVPRTIGCPRVCWNQPRAVVVATGPDRAYVTVHVDGDPAEQTHRVHVDNVRRSAPRPPTPAKPKVPKARPMAEGYTEATLF